MSICSICTCSDRTPGSQSTLPRGKGSKTVPSTDTNSSDASLMKDAYSTDVPYFVHCIRIHLFLESVLLFYPFLCCSCLLFLLCRVHQFISGLSSFILVLCLDFLSVLLIYQSLHLFSILIPFVYIVSKSVCYNMSHCLTFHIV